MRVSNAWYQGFTGKGVVVTILDDGIEINHPDLKRNYDAYASYDVNGNDDIPQPRYDYSDENKHGTRCAGEVAAAANNNVCNVGVAFDAKIGGVVTMCSLRQTSPRAQPLARSGASTGGILHVYSTDKSVISTRMVNDHVHQLVGSGKSNGVRMLDGDVTDTVEARSLSLHPQHIHIYSASWGPDDDGRTVDGPATLARKAFYDGITKGRGGLGSIFVWASGNGGRESDNCNCDGYTNSIYTLSISSATETGHIPWYSEACSSTLATTFSSGSGGEKQIVTTDLHNGCTLSHTGTSASAPLAAGVVALALEANPMLTWRDMQHIVVETAKPDGLKATDWRINGRGRRVSHSFGFGLMDADAMVRLAVNWTNVADQHICEVVAHDSNRVIPQNGRVTFSLYVDGCAGTHYYVKYLEHVEAKITLTSTKRGAMQIYLTSPSGTRSTLLARRPSDSASDGFNKWSFMTTHNWGEPARGTWLLQVENADSSDISGILQQWSLVMYGTDISQQENKRRQNRIHMTPAYVTSTSRMVHIETTESHQIFKPRPWKSQMRYEHSHRTYYDSDFPNIAIPEVTTPKATTRKPVPPPAVDRYVSNDFYNVPRVTQHGQCAYETMTLEQYAVSLSMSLNHGSNVRHQWFRPRRIHHRDWNRFYRRINPGEPTKRGRHSKRHRDRQSGMLYKKECRPGYFLLGSNCVSRCPLGYYGLVTSRTNRTTLLPSNLTLIITSHSVCHRCPKYCEQCEILDKPECIECQRGFTLTKSSGGCHPTPLSWVHLHQTVIISAFCVFLVIFVSTCAVIKFRSSLTWCRKWWCRKDLRGRYNGVAMEVLEPLHVIDTASDSEVEVRT